MTIRRLEEKRGKKNYNTILTDKLQKYQHYQQVKLITMVISHVKKYYPKSNMSDITS